MAIPQSRIVALLAAGLDFQKGLHEARERLRCEAKALRQGADPTLVAEMLDAYTMGGMADEITSTKTLALESKHIQRTWRDNEKRAERARRRRADLGLPNPPAKSPSSPTAELMHDLSRTMSLPPKTTAPSSLDRPFIRETRFAAEIDEIERLFALNEERAKRGLPPIQPEVPAHLRQSDDQPLVFTDPFAKQLQEENDEADAFGGVGEG